MRVRLFQHVFELALGSSELSYIASSIRPHPTTYSLRLKSCAKGLDASRPSYNKGQVGCL